MNKCDTCHFYAFDKDIDVVEIQIEVYGLGRYYGLHGDMNNLIVPLDILGFLAKHYNMDIKNNMPHIQRDCTTA